MRLRMARSAFWPAGDYELVAKSYMGVSNPWGIRSLVKDERARGSLINRARQEATFPNCTWAIDLSDTPFPGRTSGDTQPQFSREHQWIGLGDWYWQSGFEENPVLDLEISRDQNFRAMFGAWDVIRNLEKRYPVHRLNWAAHIAGKRESRRLLGDVVLSIEDIQSSKPFEDAAFPCTWDIARLIPDPQFIEGNEGQEFLAIRGKR